MYKKAIMRLILFMASDRPCRLDEWAFLKP